MKQLILTTIALFTISFTIAQSSLSDYDYVIVPEQFEFLNQKNKYRLNEMTKFYLKKYDFNAFLANETPDLKRCDGLFVDLEKNNRLLQLGIEIVLKDCKGNEVFRSKRGLTSFKEWSKAYPDALRNAFNTFEDIDFSKIYVNENTIQNGVVSSGIDKEEILKDETTTTSVKFLNFERNGQQFLLRKTETGFVLYQGNTSNGQALKLLGTIIVNKEGSSFVDQSNKTYDAYFDTSGNLTIFKGDTPLYYKKQH